MVLVLVLAAVAGLVAGEEEACRPRPLGLMDHTIRDWQLAASSVVSRAEDPECAVKHARLYAEGGRAWCPEQRRENEWILVDLGVQSEIAAIMTQVIHSYYTVNIFFLNLSKYRHGHLAPNTCNICATCFIIEAIELTVSSVHPLYLFEVLL